MQELEIRELGRRVLELVKAQRARIKDRAGLVPEGAMAPYFEMRANDKRACQAEGFSQIESAAIALGLLAREEE